MNLIRSELAEHKKVLDKFQDLPADLRIHIQSFYKSILPTISCPYCNWASVPPAWTIYNSHHFCCAWGRLNTSIYH